MPLAGRAAVITGASRGIGAAVARTFAEAGARLVLAARSADRLGKLVEELRSYGAQVWAVPCDVTVPRQVESLREEAVEQLGPVEILINNAGIADSAPLKAVSLERWNEIFAVNVTGPFLCSQAFLPSMVERRWGRIVNVASIAGKAGAAYISPYSASKHALVGFTRSVGAEVARHGVTVNAICPGYVDTDMTTESVARIAAKTGLPAEKAIEHILSTNPQHRLIEAEEVAYLALCLCDPRAKGVNSQSIVLDGGAVQS